MLQQTQVDRVIPKWQEFTRIYPTPAACAAAPLGDVIHRWQGLGFPRRAKHLHLAATQISESGCFPDDLAGLLALPGVGPYTARAVLAFAYEHDTAVVDTNIGRLYARVVGGRLSNVGVRRVADAASPVGVSWGWNQCVMELGALVCRSRTPGCDVCPVVEMCAWQGNPDQPDPAKGSAGVSTAQSRFEGSGRQARGRLMKAISPGSVGLDTVAEVMGRSEQVADRLLADLVAEGLCVVHNGRVGLPGHLAER